MFFKKVKTGYIGKVNYMRIVRHTQVFYAKDLKDCTNQAIKFIKEMNPNVK